VLDEHTAAVAIVGDEAFRVSAKLLLFENGPILKNLPRPAIPA
jgi:hypothetical protein